MNIGIDIGGTNIGAGLVDDKNNIICETSIPTNGHRTYEEVLKDMAKLVERLIRKSNISKDDVKGVGIGIPGIVDSSRGLAVEVVNLRWYKKNLKKDFEALIGYPVYIGNDATVAGLAEYKVGVMQGYNSGILYTLGTGIGAGIIINGRVYDGAHGIGSEVGHMIVGENFYNCNCGRNGCLETFASSTAIIKYTQKLINEGNITIMMKMAGGDIDRIDGRIIFEAAKIGDEVANLVVDRMVKYLAIGIVNTMCMIDPEVYVLGGGLSKAGDFLLDKVRQAVEKYRYFRGVDGGKIVLSKLGNGAGIIGAAALVD